jgi:para-nitrobenzyl esterase
MSPTLATALCTLLALAAPAAAEPTARLESGVVHGKLAGPEGEVAVFLGVPFARPPVGPRRWLPPEPVEAWTGQRDCTQPGASCPQPKSPIQPLEGPVSEDCLYLNVWCPAQRGQSLRPVMVWIHGGGFTNGSGAKPLYDGVRMAREGVVLVTINYRLGPFGFLAHPALSRESAQGVSGNYGLLDQIAALRWVKQNIAALGGDPNCVTIFGESAGAVSVGCLLVSPLAKGLFHRAILESGTADSIRASLRSDSAGEASMEQTGRGVAKQLGIAGDGAEAAAALREKSADELLAAANPRVGLFGKGTKFWPCVDGHVLPDRPRTLMQTGKAHDVPVMIGTNADEGTLFSKYQLPIKRPLGYQFVLQLAFGADAPLVSRMFPAPGADDVPQQVDRVLTLSCFTASARRTARWLAETRKSPVYLYYFSRVSPALAAKGMGATHGAEIFYIFGTAPSRMEFTPQDAALSQTMRSAWIRFARSGDPNGNGLPAWPTYQAAKDEHLEFGDEIRTGSGLWRDACDLFDRIGPSALGADVAH